MHSSTKLVLAVVAGALLWANAVESPLAQECGAGGPPDEYGFVSQYLYMRGWPLSPWMFAIVHGMREHLEESVLWGVLAADACLAFVTLFAVASLMELGIRKWENRGAGACQFTLGHLLLAISLLTPPMMLAYFWLNGPKWVQEVIGVFAIDAPRGCLFAFCLMAVYLALVCCITANVVRHHNAP